LVKKYRITRASGFKERLLGLIPYKTLSDNEIFFIKDCSAIHTFFMHFPIDVIFTDKAGLIVSLKEALLPWRVFSGSRGARDVYEAIPGIIRRLNLKKGDNVKRKLK